ncbi:MAG: endonuclease/exonuclease/phosphatase family protein, partial [Prolixibacteraceae bacterium]|nr:endonuclease/exonuclease/phosphatase family protein [Prolixibacteraceae bacterium]
MKLISWNVNGIRAVAKKDFFNDFQTMNPDALCLQETKAQDDQVLETLVPLEGYHVYVHSAEKKGYSGVAIISKQKPLSISKGIGDPE